MASHIKKYEIVTLAVHLTTFYCTQNKWYYWPDPRWRVVLCGAVWYRYEEGDGGGEWKLESLNMHFFCVFYIAKVITSGLATAQLET